MLFERLLEYDVRVSPTKCELGQSSLEFLGHYISAQGVRPLQKKVNIVKDFPLPSTIRKLRGLLGVVNYYHRFIQHAADILQPLGDLLKGKALKSTATVRWTDAALHAFEAIKIKLDEVEFLTYPAAGAELSLMTDASNMAVGAVL